MNDKELEAIRYAGKINKQAIDFGINVARPGMSLKELDLIIEKCIVDANCKPAFKGYREFPGTACLSVNDVAVHGIPSDYTLKQYDLLTIDVGSEFEGWFADAAKSIIVGEIENSSENPLFLHRCELIEAAQAILQAQLNIIKAGTTLLDVVKASEAEALKHNANFIFELGGHQIGKAIHLEPFISNAIDPAFKGLKRWRAEYDLTHYKFEEGLAYCLEPVITLGNPKCQIDDDGWTVRTVDGSDVAHEESCILITKEGYELLS